MFGSINLVPYFLIAFIALTIGSYFKGRLDGKDTVQVQFESYKSKQIKINADLNAAARSKEQELQASANNLQKVKDDEIRKISNLNASLVDSLRNRKARTDETRLPINSSDPEASCTGKQLYREDAEFLARIAREADEITVSLNQCYAQYDSLLKK